ncbi:MAG: hypothetical protein AAB225_20060 [Acidobacteriota bacterium]
MLLSLDAMHERHRALTESIAGSYQEAAAVCLSRHHLPPLPIMLSDNRSESSGEIIWTAPDGRTLAAWANSTDTTEAGACACVLAAVEKLRGLVAVRRAETGTGADYYVGLPGAGDDDLEECLRLEISGVDSGGHREVTKRLLEKTRQARAGNSNLPAVAGVIGFSARLLMLRDVEDAA